jgi:hypothetical protein
MGTILAGYWTGFAHFQANHRQYQAKLGCVALCAALNENEPQGNVPCGSQYF